MTPREIQSRFEDTLLQPADGDNRVPDLSDMGRVAGNARVHEAATTTALICLPKPVKRRRQSRTKPTEI
jgi:hypothetical protein